MKTTYFDTNTLSNVSQLRDDAGRIPGITEVRRELLSSASKRTIAVSQHLLTEMAGYESGKRRPYFEADMAFLNQLSFLKVFKPQGELMRLEVQHALTGAGFSPFIEAHLPIEYNDPEWQRLFDGERQWVKEAKGIWVQFESEARARIDKKYPNLNERRTQLALGWQQDRHGTVERLVRRKLRAVHVQLGLHDDESTWPAPQLLPTFWGQWSYLLARSILIEISPEPPKESASDVFDWLHYQSAAHADEFVTSDEDFLTIIREAPEPQPKILSLKEWVALLQSE